MSHRETPCVRKNTEARLVLLIMLTSCALGITHALKDAGVRDHVKVMVGGAPVTPQFAAEIGADAYGENASEAGRLAREMAGAA